MGSKDVFQLLYKNRIHNCNQDAIKTNEDGCKITGNALLLERKKNLPVFVASIIPTENIHNGVVHHGRGTSN